MRKAQIQRQTKETQILASVNLDGTGKYEIKTNVGFLDHMLEQLSRHSLIDIKLEAKGDTHVDYHHITEDVGIVLGQAISKALGDRKGINRYGYVYAPMDESLVRSVIDLSNRPHLVWNVSLKRDKIGDMDSELFKEWFSAFAQNCGATLHISCLYGENSHHIAEASFKALARCLRVAIEIDERKKDDIPSTKGVLGS